MRFHGRVVLVTGAGASIGRSAALRFAEEGAAIAITDIDTEALDETARLVDEQQALALQADVTRPDAVARAVRSAVERFGRIDILFNSAGVFEIGSTVETSENDWDRLINVNLKGTFLCAKYVVPEMIRQGGGAIVNAASIAGLISFPCNAAYSASKGGVVLLTKSLALDYASDNIRVNCVCPYSIDGPMMDRYFARHPEPEEARRAVEVANPMGRLGTIAEVVESVLFLASDAASYITGVALPIDGGYLAK